MASHQVKILEVCKVAPASPPDSSLPRSLPLTYYDLAVYRFPPVQRLFLYHLPCSTSTFLNTHLPNLKHSLSHALRDFYPLVGNLCHDTSVPTICYSDGDAVAFTVAESVDDDFHELTTNHPRSITRLRPLVPTLTPSCKEKQPVMSLQVTLFPDQGVGVGICIRHAVVDGTSSIHFMKTWAGLCRSVAPENLPFYDRSMIQDPVGLTEFLMAQIESYHVGNKKDEVKQEVKKIDFGSQTDIVRATLVFTRAMLDKLKQHVYAQKSTSCSDFSLAAAVMWICLVKLRKTSSTTSVDDEMECFAFPASFRARSTETSSSTTTTGTVVPSTYFGNCLCSFVVEMRRSDLVGENGLVLASVAIWGAIKGLKEVAASKTADVLLSLNKRTLPFLKTISVGGSPKFGVYEVDFGWGRPRKVEMVSAFFRGVATLAENGDEEEGGLEVGITLPADEMPEFTGILEGVMATV